MRLSLPPSFPIAKATWPIAVERPPIESHTGVDYDTSWSRRYPARLTRAVLVDDVLRPLAHVLAWPRVHGLDRIQTLEAPAIFAANHNSHLDTTLLLASLPERFRHRTVVAAAADYFFSNRTVGTLSALAIGAIPMDRTKVGRRSADLAAELLGDGWNLVIFPEGGRSPDGWGQTFRGGAAYLALRCGRPVVPVYLEGTRRIWKRGAKWPTPARRGAGVQLSFGAPLRPTDGEDSRRFSARIEAAVAALADEWTTDWWTARKRAATGATPALTGPRSGAWRRAWAVDAGRSANARRTWP
ncbi:MAG: 1-acyl-sn-glycerol-3-phosphate acyltransferase [Actinomycetota bacterium]|nr:1-acyl-sn-glycerol-3-phosphate acyltransferase [Actinomycetota bacterium]